MLSGAARNPINLGDIERTPRTPAKFASRKIWLPKMLYDALPYFYLTSRCAAFLATLSVSGCAWLRPPDHLFSGVCAPLRIVI